MELLDDAWSLDDDDKKMVSSDTILNIFTHPKRSEQCTPPMSLDLEWENLPEMDLTSYMTDGEDRELQFTTNSISTCSCASSHDSLEWDPIIGGMSELKNAETDQLLQKFEMLNVAILKESQKWTS